jgi:hypothetical protein
MGGAVQHHVPEPRPTVEAAAVEETHARACSRRHQTLACHPVGSAPVGAQVELVKVRALPSVAPGSWSWVALIAVDDPKTAAAPSHREERHRCGCYHSEQLELCFFVLRSIDRPPGREASTADNRGHVEEVGAKHDQLDAVVIVVRPWGTNPKMEAMMVMSSTTKMVLRRPQLTPLTARCQSMEHYLPASERRTRHQGRTETELGHPLRRYRRHTR